MRSAHFLAKMVTVFLHTQVIQLALNSLNSSCSCPLGSGIFFMSNIFELMATHYIFAELENQPTTFKASFRKAWSTKWMLFKVTFLDFLMGFLARRGSSEDSLTERKPSAIVLFTAIFCGTCIIELESRNLFYHASLVRERIGCYCS